MMISKFRFASVERFRPAALSMLLLLASTAASVPVLASDEAPASGGSYQDLVGLFDEFLAFREAAAARADFSAAAVAGRRERMRQFQRRIDDIEVASWTRAQQVGCLRRPSTTSRYGMPGGISPPPRRRESTA